MKSHDTIKHHNPISSHHIPPHHTTITKPYPIEPPYICILHENHYYHITKNLYTLTTIASPPQTTPSRKHPNSPLSIPLHQSKPPSTVTQKTSNPLTPFPLLHTTINPFSFHHHYLSHHPSGVIQESSGVIRGICILAHCQAAATIFNKPVSLGFCRPRINLLFITDTNSL